MPNASITLDLFGNDALPEGFRYQPDFLSRDEEQSLLQQIVPLPFREFRFQVFTWKRRIVSYGWRYDFNCGGLTKAVDTPDFFRRYAPARKHLQLSLRALFSRSLSRNTRPGRQSAGTRIDRSSATSLGFLFCRPAPSACGWKGGHRWERRNLTVEPRSVYLLRGPSRTEWEHSIPGADSLRYSITFRNVLEGASQA